MVFKIKKQKAVSPLISGVLIIFISIAVAGIIIIFSNAYFGSLGDIQKYKNNKQNLEVMNNILNNLKTQNIGSYKLLNISPTNQIHFDKSKNNITITQKIKNISFLENQKDSISYGNINIKKSMDSLIFTLSLNNVDLNNNYDATTTAQQINFNVIATNNNVPNIRITRVNENQSLFVQINYNKLTYDLGETVNLNSTIYNANGDYNCEWDSNIDGLLSNQCDLTTSNLSSGDNKITLTINDKTNTATNYIVLHINPPITILLNSPTYLSEYDYNSNINFIPEIINSDNDKTCVWTSSIDGIISNDCNSFSYSELSSGNHKITLTVTDKGTTISKSTYILIHYVPIEATGGTVTKVGDYEYHTFTESGSLDLNQLGTYGLVDVLVVAGGGGSGYPDSDRDAGGGGAGGLIYIEDYNVETTGTIPVTVGLGGEPANGSGRGKNGKNSTFGPLTAIGGGGGGGSSKQPGADGGSGGGAEQNIWYQKSGGSATQTTTNDGYPNTGFGNDGGNSLYYVNSAGGGGAGGPGIIGAGGPGMTIWGNTYAKGGDPGRANGNAADNTGNGANGGNNYGGSGIVIVRFKYKLTNKLQATITSPTNLDIYDYTQNVEFKSKIINNIGDYNCEWDSNIDGLLSNNCDFNKLGLTIGYHKITLKVTDQNSTTNQNIYINITNHRCPQAEGGTVTRVGDYEYHTFTYDGSLNITSLGSDGLVDVLVVAGGGGSSQAPSNDYDSGGGGAGGLIYIEDYNVETTGTIPITVGLGGEPANSSSNKGKNGKNSTFGPLTAIGGGGGGGANYTASLLVGSAGGSGGGAATDGTYSKSGGSATQTTTNDGYPNTGFGNAGGDSISTVGSAGGGGAGGPGTIGAGGPGMTIWGNTYAKGGDPGANGNAADNTGNGANGCKKGNGAFGFNGGSGIVIVRFQYQNYKIKSTIDEPINNKEYLYNKDIDFNSTTIRNSGDYNCSWDSNVEGHLSNDCNFTGQLHTLGDQKITLTTTDKANTITTDVNISVVSVIIKKYIQATGGTITFSGDYKIHTFTSDGDFTITDPGDGLVDVLVVAGGGGGGSSNGSSAGGGGGGAGGLIYDENYSVSQGTINVTVGAGGIGGSGGDVSGTNGENSSFDSLVAIGGGGGGARSHNGAVGGSGGAGGSRGGSGAAGTINQGNSGGDGDPVASGQNAGGGGGGANSNGSIGIMNSNGGNGGDGLYFGDKFTDTLGDNGYFSGGGGGGISGSYLGGNGGLGGGGNGGGGSSNGTAGINNTGGGGGGASKKGYAGGNGGSGIVIIRYKYQN